MDDFICYDIWRQMPWKCWIPRFDWLVSGHFQLVDLFIEYLKSCIIVLNINLLFLWSASSETQRLITAYRNVVTWPRVIRSNNPVLEVVWSVELISASIEVSLSRFRLSDSTENEVVYEFDMVKHCFEKTTLGIICHYQSSFQIRLF